MKNLQKVRLLIKSKNPKIYHLIRGLLFPFYLKINSKKRSDFKEKIIKEITHAGLTFRIKLDPNNGFVDTEIFANGIYEPDILNLIKKYLPLNGTFIDIGANIGQHSLFAACVVGEDGKVVSFEPIPQIANQLKESVALNSFNKICQVHEIATSNSDDFAELKIKPGNVGGSGLHHKDDSFEKISIKTALADTYLAEIEKINLIKIDTEGHEVETLSGLNKTIQKHRPVIIVEYSPSLVSNKEKYAHDFFMELSKHQYTYLDIEEGYQEVIDIKHWISVFNKSQTNLLCLPK